MRMTARRKAKTTRTFGTLVPFELRMVDLKDCE